MAQFKLPEGISFDQPVEEPPGFFTNTFRRVKERAANLGGNLYGGFETLGKFADERSNIGGFAATPGATLSDESPGYEYLPPKEWAKYRDQPDPSKLLDDLQDEWTNKSFGSVERNYWENMKTQPGLVNKAKNLGAFAVETGITSIPDMIGAVTMFPAWWVSFSEEMAQERAVSDGRTEPNEEDWAIAGATTAVIGAMERFGFEQIASAYIKGGSAFTKLLKAAAGEGGTEFIQEQMEYAAETAGTKKGKELTAEQYWLNSLERGAQGAVGGVTMGTTMAAPGVAADAVRERMAEKPPPTDVTTGQEEYEATRKEVQDELVSPTVRSLEANKSAIDDALAAMPEQTTEQDEIVEETPLDMPQLEQVDQAWDTPIDAGMIPVAPMETLPEAPPEVAEWAQEKVEEAEPVSELPEGWTEKPEQPQEALPETGEVVEETSVENTPEWAPAEEVEPEPSRVRTKPEQPQTELPETEEDNIAITGSTMSPEQALERVNRWVEWDSLKYKAGDPVVISGENVEGEYAGATGVVDFIDPEGLYHVKLDDKQLDAFANKGWSPDALSAPVTTAENLTEAETQAQLDEKATEPVEDTGWATATAAEYQTKRPEFGGLILSFRPDDMRNGKKAAHYYGELDGTIDKDNMPKDVILNKDYNADQETPIFIVNQLDWDTKEFRQHKIMAGFESIAAAKQGYIDQFDAKGFGAINEISPAQFEKWKQEDGQTAYTPKKTLRDVRAERKAERALQQNIRATDQSKARLAADPSSDDLITWARKLGGLNMTKQSDIPQGRLSHLNQQNRTIGLSGIEQKGDKGMSLAELTEAAWEAEYIRDNDTSQLIDLLYEAEDGEPIYSDQNSEYLEREAQEAYERVQYELEERELEQQRNQAKDWADFAANTSEFNKVDPETARLMSLAEQIDPDMMVDIASRDVPETDVQAALQEFIDESTAKKVTREAAAKAASETSPVNEKGQETPEEQADLVGKTAEEVSRQAIEDAKRAKDTTPVERPAEAQSADDLFANDGQLEPDLFAEPPKKTLRDVQAEREEAKSLTEMAAEVEESKPAHVSQQIWDTRDQPAVQDQLKKLQRELGEQSMKDLAAMAEKENYPRSGPQGNTRDSRTAIVEETLRRKLLEIEKAERTKAKPKKKAAPKKKKAEAGTEMERVLAFSMTPFKTREDSFTREGKLKKMTTTPMDKIKLTAEYDGKTITHTASYWLKAIDERIVAVNKLRGCV